MSFASSTLGSTESTGEPDRHAPPAFLQDAIAQALARIDAALPDFTDAWPEPSSVNGTYAPRANTEWTNGFWTVMLWLAY